jgi:hypothetical protein
MIFFDESKPNKYNAFKKLFVPRECKQEHLYRVGLTDKKNPDGSYVVHTPTFETVENVMSYGIGDNWDFEKECQSIGMSTHMFDAQISDPEVGIPFFKENLSAEIFSEHLRQCGIDRREANLLKLDVEGAEWDFLANRMDLVYRHFSHICIELHDLIEEIPDGWEVDELNKIWKKRMYSKLLILRELFKNYWIVHMHANNHSPRYVDFPDSLELCLVRRGRCSSNIRKDPFPIKGFDFPNFSGRLDYVLDWWI